MSVVTAQFGGKQTLKTEVVFEFDTLDMNGQQFASMLRGNVARNVRLADERANSLTVSIDGLSSPKEILDAPAFKAWDMNARKQGGNVIRSISSGGQSYIWSDKTGYVTGNSTGMIAVSSPNANDMRDSSIRLFESRMNAVKANFEVHRDAPLLSMIDRGVRALKNAGEFSKCEKELSFKTQEEFGDFKKLCGFLSGMARTLSNGVSFHDDLLKQMQLDLVRGGKAPAPKIL
tara:strand:- start:108 stop:803 length:696 start_codon:yes stop_codon:yes gene_type:complete